jgi:hypothetical protein
MKNFCVIVLWMVLAVAPMLADTQDTALFRTALSPANEVPPVTAANVSGTANITVRVTRDNRTNFNGNILAATVIFEIDYTVAAATTFTGLHIHQALAGSNGSIVIDTGITATNPIAVASGSGRITRTVNYASTDTNGLLFVRGLLAKPDAYYVNIHSTTNLSGLMRGQLQRTSLTFRPILHPLFENPPLTELNAEGSALVEVRVNRDVNNAITSGTVLFDVDYRFPGPVTLTGLHIHAAAAGVNGGIVIGTDLNTTTNSITNPTGRGTVFRIVNIDGTVPAALAALNGLMNDPSQYYINLHTSVNGGGAMRGQLADNLYVFFNQMTGAEENPPVVTNAIGNSITYVRFDRDSAGTIVSGAVSFNINFNMGGPVTFTGLHIHNGNIGVNGGVMIDTGITGTNTVTDDDGVGFISREVNIDASTRNGQSLDALRGLVENPEAYYVNLHTTTNLGGMIRAQLERETYRFKTNMTPANEVPPINSTALGTGWLTIVVSRDGNSGAINGGTTTFDVNHTLGAPATITGLHIHIGAAGGNGPVRIDTGITQASPLESATGNGNITRTVITPATDTNGIAALNSIASNPAGLYVNLHTSTNLGGLIRSQLLPTISFVAQAAGGSDWITGVTVTNASATATVQGMLNFYRADSTAMPAAITDPNIPFLLPPSGSARFNLHNKGDLTTGFAGVFTDGNVTLDAFYSYPTFTDAAHVTPVTARSVSIPVRVGTTATQNTGISVLALNAGNVVFTLRDGQGVAIAGGSRSVAVTAGQQLVGFVRDLLPTVTQAQFTGTMTAEIQASSGTGQLSAVAIQFNGALAPVTMSPLP